jgi:hypothetical protein
LTIIGALVVVQFPIECSLPWMLVEYVIESQEAGLLESVLMPFDIYNDAADQALRTLKQRFLYDEIEAEVFTQDTFSLRTYSKFHDDMMSCG